MNEVMNMGKGNPYSFYVVLADGIMEIPQESNLSWITLFYALPKELVEKRPAYLELPRNIHQLLHSEEYRKEIYEQRTIGNHARCDGCQAACGGAAYFQSRGIQPAEQYGLSHFTDWRPEAGNEAGLTGMAAESHQ